MRALLATSLAVALVVTALPAEARPDHPFPKTEKATRELVGDILVDADASSEKMLRLAHKLIQKAKRVGELPSLPTPATPDPTIGALEIRATLVQPGVRVVDQTIGAMWLGASQGHWTGAYWAESDGGGNVFPSLLDIDEMGIILFLDGGALAQSDSINVTYHFLGIDGTYTTHALGEIAIFAQMPVLERVDVGGAHASARGEEPEALLITPWNLHDHNVTMGMTLHATDGTSDDINNAACLDVEAPETEPGCRLLYVLPFEADLERLDVWHLDENGERVVDRTLTRAQMLAGYTFV